MKTFEKDLRGMIEWLDSVIIKEEEHILELNNMRRNNVVLPELEYWITQAKHNLNRYKERKENYTKYLNEKFNNVNVKLYEEEKEN